MSSSSKQESFNYNFLFWFLIIQSMFFCLHSLHESSSSSSKNDPKGGGGRRIIKCIESEREALLTFKAGLITYPTNFLSSWEGHQADCCKWLGVSCNKNTTHVIGLNLRGNWDDFFHYLAGEITPSLLHLKHLRHLDLSSNNFYGTSIPRFIGSFRKLTYLNLSSAGFVGLVPPQLGNLSRLRYLDLNDPYVSFKMHVDNLRWLPRLSSLKYLDISGVNLSSVVDWFQMVKMLPSLTTLHLEFCDLHFIPTSYLSYINFSTSLNTLDLSYNLFNSSLPQWIWNISSLTSLDLNHNSFHGPIPVEIGKLSQLSHIDLSDNSFSGLISESHFTNLTDLKTLILSMNPLTISVDESWVPPFQLDFLDLGSLRLGPHFPSWLHNQMKISWLRMSNCSISTIVPDWFWNKLSTSISYLDLSNNLISGRLPKNLEIAKYGVVHLDSNRFEGYVPSSLLSTGRILHLSNNLFSGSIPNIEVSYLTNLDLSNNHFNSSIPASLCNVTESLDLSNNSFSGEIPNKWQIQSAISIINLANNHFSGRVPNSLGLVANLEVLILRHNNLSGQFPSFLQSCDGLKFLDLSQNNFYGIIPTWLGENLTSLSFLSLRSNFFSGNIPLRFGQLQNLAFLDLANNKLSGLIPHCFGNLSAMASTLVPNITYLYDDSYYFSNPIYFSLLEFTKGEELEFMKNHYFMQSIDLSDNYLTGEIPEEIGALIGLMNLNLSSNRLIGNIPEHIGRMRSLESLDLSRNELSGNIPLSISDLNFLSYLNLSYNHLSGKIPSGNQIQTLSDPSIYAGNIGLCGPPLPTNCSSSRSDTKNNGEYVKGDEERVWLYYSIGLGYIVGFWAACGVLLFNKTWRRAYFQFFDNSYDWFYVEVSLALTKLKRARVGRN